MSPSDQAVPSFEALASEIGPLRLRIVARLLIALMPLLYWTSRTVLARVDIDPASGAISRSRVP